MPKGGVLQRGQKWADIPGFSRYKAQVRPFAIYDTKLDRFVNAHPRKRGAPFYTIRDDNGKRRQWSSWTLAALTYHGQPPHGTIAHCYGDEITPENTRWIDRRLAASYRGRAFDLTQRDQILELYYEQGLTQDEIAARYGVAQASISRIIAKQGREV